MAYVETLKQRHDVRVYTPFKYFKGLHTRREIQTRFLEIVKRKDRPIDDPKTYRQFQTDIGKPTRPSKYTQLFYKTYGRDKTSLKRKSEATGVPLDILQQVYAKGKAAWRTGHRVGANPQQWGYARVHSFLMLGCTVFSADFTLFEQALSKMSIPHQRRWLSLPMTCPKSTLDSPHYRKRQTYIAFLEYKRRLFKR